MPNESFVEAETECCYALPTDILAESSLLLHTRSHIMPNVLTLDLVV